MSLDHDGDLGMRDDLSYFLDNISDDEAIAANPSPFPYPGVPLKVSDSITYGPRFIQIFDAFQQTIDHTIDLRRHLFCLCIEYMIPFITWARGPAQSFIKGTLLENDYTRCEVRNGIVIVIIYTFAATQARGIPGSDMFITLQDSVNGLGIANKISLKIYNDPLFFLTFLKTTVTCLISSGAIPDNERVNQRRKAEEVFENKSELDAFHSLKALLIQTFEMKKLDLGLECVKQVTQLWDNKTKTQRISYLKFSEGLVLLKSILNPTGDENLATEPSPATVAVPLMKRKRVDDEGSFRPIPSVIFTRHNSTYWKFRLTAFFDFKQLLSDFNDGTIEISFVLDEKNFAEYYFKSSEPSASSAVGGLLPGDPTSLMFNLGDTYNLHTRGNYRSNLQNNLVSELSSSGSIVSFWSKTEFSQLSLFLSAWQDRPEISLVDYWRQCSTMLTTVSNTLPHSQPLPQLQKAQGLLAIEILTSIGFVIRPCPELGIHEESWGVFYPGDIESFITNKEETGASHVNFGSFLCHLFPQLLATMLRNSEFTEKLIVVVTHISHQHRKHPNCWESPPPASADTSRYRTIGNITESASEILRR